MNKVKCLIDSVGNKVWRLNDELHNEDGPAIIKPDGTKAWCLHGKFHREDGPAIIDLDGYKSWFLNNRSYSFDDWCDKLKLSIDRRIELKLCYG